MATTNNNAAPVELVERPEWERDRIQAVYLRKLRDELVAAVTIAAGAGLQISIHCDWDTRDDGLAVPPFEIELHVMREI